MYFTNGGSRVFEMLMRGKTGFGRCENGGCADCVRIAIPVTFTGRIESIHSVCTQNVRMSRAS